MCWGEHVVGSGTEGRPPLKAGVLGQAPVGSVGFSGGVLRPRSSPSPARAAVLRQAQAASGLQSTARQVGGGGRGGALRRWARTMKRVAPGVAALPPQPADA